MVPSQAHKELASGTVGVLAPSHRKHTLVVLFFVEFGINGPTWAPGPGHTAGPLAGVGTAALDHEVLDDPVKGEPIVKTILGQLHEVLTVFGGNIVPEFDFESAGAGFDFGGGVGHGSSWGLNERGTVVHLFSEGSDRPGKPPGQRFLVLGEPSGVALAPNACRGFGAGGRAIRSRGRQAPHWRWSG